MPVLAAEDKGPLYEEGGKIANGDQGGEAREAPPVAYGDSPLLVEGAFGPMRASAHTDNIVNSLKKSPADPFQSAGDLVYQVLSVSS